MSAVASPGRGGATTTATMAAPPRQPPPSQPSPRQGRLRECLGRIPLCTTLITVLCLSLHLSAVLLGWNINEWAISPAAVVDGGEYYRIFTSPFFHMGILHIAMNMLSFVGIGAFLEFQCGTLYLFLTIAYAIVLTNGLYIGICYLLAFYITNNMRWWYYASVGFSGVIFQLAVIESYTAPPGATRNLFFGMRVPAKLYPWLLLIIIQVVMPHISFIGHLSGVLIGVLQSYGCLGFLFPPRPCVNRMEASAGCSLLVRCGQYILAPEASPTDRNPACSALGACFGRLGIGGGRSRNFGGGATGTAATTSSPPGYGARSVASPGRTLGSASRTASIGGAGGAGAGPAGGGGGGGVESPHTRAVGADPRGWRRIQDGEEEEEDVELGGGAKQAEADAQRRIVL